MLGRYRYDCRGGCWDVTGMTVEVGVGTLQVRL